MAGVPPQPKDGAAPTANQGQPQLVDVDPIAQFQSLVPNLQDSLTNLVKTAANVFYQNAQADGCVKNAETSLQRVEKCLEDFYSKCDQIELHLRLAIECSAQNADSTKNTPIPVQGRPGKMDPGSEAQTYAQYLSTIRTQISCAKEIHDSLLECASRIGGQQGGLGNAPIGPGMAGLPAGQGQSMHGMAPMNQMHVSQIQQP